MDPVRMSADVRNENESGPHDLKIPRPRLAQKKRVKL